MKIRDLWKMTKSFKALALIVVFPPAETAFALDATTLVAADQSHLAQRHATAETARSDPNMQALCREVLVDTDEGYGVTNRESRFVCDEARQ
ncbi:MAG: hypothetical protein N2444_00870 [Methylocystis sp.]|nr:hypothetical protein [Methylocystis sp.]